MYICASCEASLTQLSSIQLSWVKRELSSVPGIQCKNVSSFSDCCCCLTFSDWSSIETGRIFVPGLGNDGCPPVDSAWYPSLRDFSSTIMQYFADSIERRVKGRELLHCYLTHYWRKGTFCMGELAGFLMDILTSVHCEKTNTKNWLHLCCQWQKTEHFYHSYNSLYNFSKYENLKFSL